MRQTRKFSQFLLLLIVLPGLILSEGEFIITIHAGAIDDTREKFPKEREYAFKQGLKKSLLAGYTILKKGGKNLDAIKAALNSMEDNSTFNSGKGAKVNEKFECELDSSIMDGKSLKCGAVAGLQHIKNPINAARLVMEKSKHILLVGKAAEEFAQSHGETIVPNKYFMTPIEIKEWYDIRSDSTKKIPQHETCGCIVLDTEGHLAAGTTTGGVTNKMSGRVGDSPIIGAGTYANDDSIAVSCTGLGENMIRRSFAFDLRARMLYKNQTLEQAGKDAMSELEPLTGGYISIDNKGNVYAPFNSPGMARAYVRQDGKAKIILFTPETDFYPCDYDIEKEYQEQQAKKDL